MFYVKCLKNIYVLFTVLRIREFYASLCKYLQIEEHTVIESHPDNEIPDLRLDRPFPSLEKYMDSLELDKMDDKEHSHVPYIVILYKYLQKWNEGHGAPPKNYKEKKLFIELLKTGRLSVLWFLICLLITCVANKIKHC